MNLPLSSSKLVRFGVFEVDLRARELRKQGRKIRLQEQPCQILATLLECPGEIVTRDELCHRLWPGHTFVDFDHSLNTAIMRLREALGDSSENPRFVETLPRRGYRFIAPVQEVERSEHPEKPDDLPQDSRKSTGPLQSPVAPADDNKPKRTLSHSPKVLSSAAVVAMLGLLVFVMVRLSLQKPASTTSVAAPLKSIVVLPLENLSGDKEQDYFTDGMTDELIARLAKIRSLRVISRTTAMEYKGTHKPLSEIARELKVDAVVEGTVLRAGNRVRITAELVQVSTDRHLWAETYESRMGDILDLQSKVASAIVNEIRIKLTPEEQQQLAVTHPVNAEVYEDYLKGLYYWNRRSEQGLTTAIEYYQRATEKDPQYALAYAGLADCYGIIGATIFGTVPAAEAAPKAKAAALKALQLDDSLAEAHTSLATVRFNYDWDWAAAASGFQRAIELNPSYATAYQRYSLYLIAMGRTKESLDEITRARELDPLSISINFSMGWRLYMARQYDRSIEQLRNTLDMDANYELAHYVLGQDYEQKGEYGPAIAELEKALAISHNTPLMTSALGHAYAVSGRVADAEKSLADLREQAKNQYVSPFYVAVVYAGLGKNDEAMTWLEKAYQDRSNGLVFLKADPELDGLRSDPRFQALQEKMHLPTY